MKIRITVIQLFVLFSVLGLGYPAWSQTTDIPLAASLDALQQQYNSSLAVNPQLYNGPEYVDYAKRYTTTVGHQFFLSPDKHSGSVYYNNHYFAGLQLRYDVVLSQLLIQHATSPFTLKLINENLWQFTIDGHRFTRLVADSSAASLPTGFYEVLVDSSTVQLLAKRAKQLEEKIAQGEIQAEFRPIDKLFVRKAGVYYLVNKKRSVTQLFADHSKEVQKYIQDHKLRFKKAQRETDIVLLTRYYAGLLAP
ncbi:hypothetical protein [Hymenobacter crusticola]|uniref:Uncharacterized protein n=1 Tax=Hymenobacter crusticola TaxID=1770526 RepID=A0A243W8Z4_9BACT|nr:hypothetical protein [Hymenobacter crusticola]OUJ71634.1 hypothetical protein BXP70_21370 [Hymenobacter crusticola]